MKIRMFVLLVASWLALGVACRLHPTGNQGAMAKGPAQQSHLDSGADMPPVLPHTAVAARDPDATEAQPPRANSKPHFFDLTNLQKFYFDKTMTSQQRLQGLMEYLKKEMADPSYPGFGPGGGPIDNGYIQLQMIGVLGHTVDAKDIAAARDKATNPALRQRLTLALGQAGDRRVAQELAKILLHHPRGFMREAAARGLYEIKDSASKGALRAALTDRYSGIAVSDVGPGPHIIKLYPVRQRAAAALRALGEKVDGIVTEVTLDVGSIAEAISWLFEDKQPDVCISAVQILGRYGQEGLPYLKKFVEENQGNKTLKAALEAARSIIQAQEQSALPAPGG